MITEAKITDIKTIQKLARTSWENAYSHILLKEQIEYMLQSMYSEEELISQISLNPRYYYYIISDEKSPVGFLGFETDYEISTTKLHRIYLIPEAKGKGYGKHSVNFLKEFVKSIGNNRIILNVNKNNSAKKIYESLGFKVYSQGIFDIGNGFVMDDYLMEFNLN